MPQRKRKKKKTRAAVARGDSTPSAQETAVSSVPPDPLPEPLPVTGRLPARTQLSLLVAPLLLLAVVFALQRIQGPYYLETNLDPAYYYLFNSTEIADLDLPPHFVHPGTPLMILGAVVVTAKWITGSLTGGWEPKIDSVIRHHNDYLTAISIVLLLLMAAVCFLAGRKIYRLTGSRVTTAVFQLSPLFWFLAVTYYPRVAPEPLEVVIGLALVWVVAPAVFGPNPSAGARNPKLAVMLGCLLACGVATKYNFATLGLLIFLLDGVRQWLRAVIAGAVTLTVWMIPVFANFSRFVEWFAAHLARAGAQGGGEGGAGWLVVHGHLLWRELTAQTAFFLLILCYLGVAVICLFVERSFPDRHRRRLLRALWLGIAIIGIHFLLTGIDFRVHYLVPAFTVTFLLNPVVAELLRRPSGGRMIRVLLAGACLAVLGTIAFSGYRSFLHHKKRTEEFQKQLAAIARKRAEMKNCGTAAYYPSSLPIYGLFFGNDFTRGHYAAALEKIHPGAVTYNAIHSSFLDWSLKRRTSDVERFVREGGCVLLQGTARRSGSVPGWQLIPVLAPRNPNSRQEGLYRLSLDASHPALISAAAPVWGAIVVEGENFSEGNLVKLASDGEEVVTSGELPAFAVYKISSAGEYRYAIRIRYASGEARPVRVRLNGKIITESACPIPTGGFDFEDQKWHDLGMFRFRQGENIFRLESDGPFPRIDKIAVKRVRG